MDKVTLFNLIIGGGAAGFAAYCGSYALHVWRTRNASRRSPGGRRRHVTLGWSIALVASGLLIMLVAFAQRYIADRRGVLSADNVFTLRLPEKSTVESLAPMSSFAGNTGGRDITIEAGSVLARFRSPQRAAEADALVLKQQVLQAEKRIVQRQPFPLDAELVRQHQDLVTERRHLEASRDQLVPAKDLVDRERAREGAKRVELKRLMAEIDRLNGELSQTLPRKELAEAHSARLRRLAEGNVAGADELAVKQAEAKVLELEVQKLTIQLAHAREQKEQVAADLKQMEGVTTGQLDMLNREIDRLRHRLARLPSEEPPLKEQLTADLARAEAGREARLQQIDVELRQCVAELAGLRRTLIVAAPFAGRVAFRAAAPNNVAEGDPILVLAPADGFRLQLRLAASEARSLARAGPVVLELDDEPAVERRFEGRLVTTRSLAHDLRHVMAELVCDPPADAVRALALADGKPIGVSLRWQPPVHQAFLFRVGAAVSAAGGLAALALVVVRTKRWTSRVQPSDSTVADAAVPPAPGLEGVTAVPTSLETTTSLAMTGMSGAVGPMLQLIGAQLREAVVRGAIDPALLAAAEWAIDRHHARAVRLLGTGLGDDEQLVQQVAALATELPSESWAEHSDGSGSVDDESRERLLRILNAVGGTRVRQCIRAAGARTESLSGAGHSYAAYPGGVTDRDQTMGSRNGGNGHWKSPTPNAPAAPRGSSAAER
jgi:hypothetical protein